MITIFCIVLLLLASTELNGQFLPIKNYNTEIGLSSSETYSIFQDSKYRYWISTDNGICLFNGLTFTNYTIEDGLPTNTIFNSFENKNDGKIWFITFGFGLTYFDEISCTFKTPKFNKRLIEIFNRRFINSCQFDKEGNLWITYNYRSLLRVDTNGKIKLYPHRDQNNICSKLEILYEGDLILARSILGKKHTNEKAYIKSKEGNSVIINGNITYNSSTAKLLVFDKSNIILAFSDELFFIKDKEKIETIKLPSKILCLAKDQLNNMWIGTEKNGIFKYSDIYFNHMPENIISLINTPVSSILCDKNNKIWFTSLTNGLFCISNTNILNYLSNYKIEKIFIDGHIISAYAHGGLTFIKKNQLFDLSSVKSNSEIKDIKRGPDGKLYICRALNKNEPYVKEIQNISSNCIEFLEKQFFIGGLNSLIIVGYNRLIQKVLDAPASIIKISKINTSTLLVGCLNGLYIFSKDSFTLVEGPVWLKSTRINDIINFKNKLYVLTDGKGILAYYDNKLHMLKQDKSISVNSPNCLEFENDSTIWIGTSEGLYKATLNNKSELDIVLKLTVNDGLPSNEINDIKLISGKLYLATNSGLSVFATDIKPTHGILPLYFEKILGNFRDTLFQGYSRNVRLNVDKKWRNLYIKFSTAKDRSNRLIGQLSYRLIKDNSIINNWTNISDDNIQFTNLEPGNYKLAVRINDNIHNKHYASIASFQLQPFYYERLWVKSLFYSVLFLLGIISIWLISKKVKYDNEIKRKMVSAEVNSLRNQMNPHFIFNALNSIQYFIFENNQEMASKFLNKFSTLIRKSLEFSKLNFITIKDEIEFLEEYLEIEKVRFQNKFDYIFEIDSGIDAGNFKIPPLLMQPLIENSIKHGFKDISHKGMLWIKLVKEPGDIISYSVKDNGVGISNGKTNDPDYKTSLSHEILKERFELLKNNLNKNSPIGMTINNLVFENRYGSEIILKLPIKYD